MASLLFLCRVAVTVLTNKRSVAQHPTFGYTIKLLINIALHVVFIQISSYAAASSLYQKVAVTYLGVIAGDLSHSYNKIFFILATHHACKNKNAFSVTEKVIYTLITVFIKIMYTYLQS